MSWFRSHAIAAAALGVFAAFPAAAQEPARRAVVLTTFQPLFSIASLVAKDSPALEVRNLAPRAEGPHDFDASSPAHRAAFEREARGALAIVTLRSLTLAPHFDELYPLARAANIRIVELDLAAPGTRDRSQLILIPAPVDSAAGRPGAEASTPPNPHVWLSLSHASILAQRLARDFAALDPPHAELYATNGRALAARLLALRAATLERLAAIDDPGVAALTEGFPYLTADLGIPVADYLLAAEPAAIGPRLAAAKVRCVLAEEPPTPEVAAAIRAAGVSLVVLSTLEEGWGDGDTLSVDGYLDGMKANLDALVVALGGR